MGSEAHDSADLKTYFDSGLIKQAKTPAQGIADAVAAGIQADEVLVNLVTDANISARARYPLERRILNARVASTTPSSNLFSIKGDTAYFKDTRLTLPVAVDDVRQADLPGNLVVDLIAKGTRSFGLFPIQRDGKLVGTVACFFKRESHRWRNHEISAFATLGDALPAQPRRPITITKATRTETLESKIGQFQRLAKQGNLIILTTNSSFGISDLFGNTEALLGVPLQKLIGDPSIWVKIVHPDDLPLLRRRLLRLRAGRGELKHELRIIHQGSGEKRWLLLRAVPHYSSEGEFLGWEGFGVDVTERRQAEEAFLDQNRRLQALFEIARALDGYKDPAAVSFSGLRSILIATQAECGFAAFVDRNTGTLEIVASIGLSESYIERVSSILSGPSLLRECIESQAGFIVDDLRAHPKAQQALAREENLRATILVPMVIEGATTGALVIFKRRELAFRDEDFTLASAAASQISLALRQAELLEDQRKQGAALASLYKVSRELAKYRGSIDFAEAVLPIIQSEFSLKRAWIGLANEQGTFIVGQAGCGVGMSRSHATTQFEISSQYPILHRVLSHQRSVSLANVSSFSPEPILEVFPDAHSLVVIPMVAVGRVMGLLAVEPNSKSNSELAECERLLTSIATEIATAILAGRFESRMADAVKMRTAGLLASGVAHNFNNLLQAILGQVSLIELQIQPGSPVRSATRTISDAAKRGAALVSQLLNFATKGSARKMPVTISSFLVESKETYRKLCGDSLSLSIETQEGGDTRVDVDPVQLQEVISNIVDNAREAIGETKHGEIRISAHTSIVKSGELGPDISPGTYCRIDIEDNGPGMSPEQEERCFEPFFTTKNIDQATGVGLSGSGLGLAASYSIVKNHDGVITVHSRAGEGTVFSIYLPALTGQQQLNNPAPDAEQLSLHRRPGVLLLGIELGVQPFISKTFESLGYRSRGVFDARHAHELLRKEPLKWGFVLLDTEGLGSRSAAICDELTTDQPHINVLCVWPSSRGGEKQELRPSSRIHHLEKPITVWGLESVLSKFRPTENEAP